MDSHFVCNLCGSSDAHQIAFRYAFKDRYLWLMECNRCSLRSIWPQPNAKEIEEMYAADYFTEADSATHHMDVDYLQILNAGDYKDGVEQMKAYAQSGNILEIGCATGNFLHALSKAGFQVKGIELSSFAVNYAKEHFGLSLINQPFDHDLLGHAVVENEFDIIIMGDVLEHFTNPVKAMQLVHTILKPGGVALIQVPGSLNLLSSKIGLTLFKWFNKPKTMYIPPYHLTEFSGKSLRAICKKAGFQKIVIEHHIKHPSSVPLRGNWLENLAKKYFQYPNYYLTKWFGVSGDRIHAQVYK